MSKRNMNRTGAEVTILVRKEDLNQEENSDL
jgi:hypothetical protein